MRPKPRQGETDAVLDASGVLRGLTVVLILVMTLIAGACAVPFGPGGSAPEDQSSQDVRRQRNQRFLDEQERTERQRQFDRVGPPSDR